LSELAGFDEAERTGLESWNDTRTDEPRACVHELVGEQARRTPAAPALGCGDGSLPYEQLEARSERLARALRRRGVGPEVRVAILLDRSPDLVVSALGVLKAG